MKEVRIVLNEEYYLKWVKLRFRLAPKLKKYTYNSLLMYLIEVAYEKEYGIGNNDDSLCGELHL